MKKKGVWLILVGLFVLGSCKALKYRHEYQADEYITIHYTSAVTDEEIRKVGEVFKGLFKHKGDVFVDKDNNGYTVGIVTVYELPSDLDEDFKESTVYMIAEDLRLKLGKRVVVQVLNSKMKVLYTRVE